MTHRMLAAPVVAIALLTGMTGKPVTAQNIAQPIVRVTDILVHSVVADAGQLLANTTVTLDVLGHTITQDVQIPLALGGTPGTPCDILNLSVGPLNLDVLGLVVNLDDCDGGPVTVDITGVHGELLGDLLCGVAGLLDPIDQVLANLEIVGGLPQGILDDLTGALTGFLNDLFDTLLTTGTSPLAAHQQGGGGGGGGHVCNILMLDIPEGVALDLLGLAVTTSPVCLDVHAERGSGNLLGNLLCSLSGLLDTHANNNALQAAVRNILALLNRLGL